MPVSTTQTFPARLVARICQAESGGIQPKGNHLRWFVPKSLGFPADGFHVYKVRYEAWEALRDRSLLTCVDFKKIRTLPDAGQGKLNWSKRNKIFSLGEHASILTDNSTELSLTDSGLVVNRPGERSHLVLRFREPLIYLRIELELEPAIRTKAEVKAYYKTAEIGRTSFQPRVVFEQPNLTDVVLPLNFKAIRRLCFVKESALIAHLEGRNGWSPVTSLQVPRTADQSYLTIKSELEKTISNRFVTASSLPEFQQQYPEPAVRTLVKYLSETIHHPEKTITVPAQHGMAPGQVRILDYLHLTALDPNVARLLALYWVDTENDKNLYILQGVYGLPQAKYVYGFAFSTLPDRIPVIPGVVTVEQLPGITYQDRKPLGQVGLKWERSVSQYSRSDKPVFYDIHRKTSGHEAWVTREKPQLANSQTEFCFREGRLPIGEKIQYEITPVDLFGRDGKRAASNLLILKDLDLPVPPKLVKARLNQRGFPWTDPANLREPDVKKGDIFLSLEYGEMQHQLSPDAEKLIFLWKAGDRTDQFEDPSGWQELRSLAVQPPLSGSIAWNAGLKLTQFLFTVKNVIVLTPEVLNHRLEQINLQVTDASNDQFQREAGRVELLLDRALLEPGLFKGYHARIGNQVYPIVDSHAGLAYQDDQHQDHRFTARLVIPLGAVPPVIPPNTEVRVTYQPFDNAALDTVRQWIENQNYSALEDAQLLVQVQINRSPGEHEKMTAGGELAVDYYSNPVYGGNGSTYQSYPVGSADPSPAKRRNTFIGRVVADMFADNSAFRLLVRMSPADFLHLLEIEKTGLQITTEGRYYAPYSISNLVLGLNGDSGDVKLDLPNQQRFETLWFSAVAVDALSQKSSRIAVPFETRVINPPQILAAPQPYPCGGSVDSPRAFAPPPDVAGYSYLCLRWDPAAAASEGELRYELARAVDKTIIATDKKNWLNGLDSAHHDRFGIVAGSTDTGHLQAGYTLNNNGTFTVQVQPTDAGLADSLKVVQNGRICVDHNLPEGVKTLCHRLVRVSLADQTIRLVCRPHVAATQEGLGQIAVGADFTAQGQPDYSAVLHDDASLRGLADEKYTTGAKQNQHRNIDAFGVVTGTPVTGTRFTDRIVGRGAGRYFYKLRIVFPNGQKTDWSPCSAGFYQLDTALPAPPSVVAVLGLEKRTLIGFRPPQESNVTGVLLFHSPGSDGSIPQEPAQELFFNPNTDQIGIQPYRLRVLNGAVNLSSLPNQSLSQIDTITAIYRIAPDGSADSSRNYFNGSAVFDRPTKRITWSEEAPEHGSPICIVYSDAQGDEQAADHLPGLFEIVHEVNGIGPRLQPQAYWLKTIKQSPINTSGGAVTLYSEATPGLAVTITNDDLPAPPDWVSVQWAQNGDQPPESQTWHASLTWQANLPGADYILERKRTSGSKWQVVHRGTHIAGDTLHYEDSEADSTQHHDYRITVCAFGKENSDFNIITLAKRT